MLLEPLLALLKKSLNGSGVSDVAVLLEAGTGAANVRVPVGALVAGIWGKGKGRGMGQGKGKEEDGPEGFIREEKGSK